MREISGVDAAWKEILEAFEVEIVEIIKHWWIF